MCWSSPLTEFALKFPPPTYEERIKDTILCSSLEILESRDGKMERNRDNWSEVQNVINESSKFRAVSSYTSFHIDPTNCKNKETCVLRQ